MFAKCTLGTKYINVDNGLSTYPDFETGVAKIQQSVIYEEMMTLEEEVTCNNLLNENFDADGSKSNNNGDRYGFANAGAVREKRNAREVAGKSKYIDCSFIMDTAACAERL